MYRIGQMNSINNQKRILQNTVMLYIRMAVIMLVSLYVSRIVLNELGETDFGIYNIVGSVVVSLVFIQNTLSSATQRFLSFELGRGDEKRTREVFSMAMTIHYLFIIVVVIILETIGLWFLNNVLSIPENRIFAANIAYQFSIAAFALNIIRIPYNAVIISYEKMNAYAILSIAEALLKLTIAYVLLVVSSDKIIVYAAMILSVTFAINLLYVFYCKIKYKQICRFQFVNDKTLFKEMLGFSGWTMLGGVTGIATNEGPNYLMNIYLGVGINTAMGLAKQVSSAVYQFTANFQTAFNPQIVKAYSSDEREYLFDLINKTSLLSFYLLFVVAFPLTLCANMVFDFWLVDVPKYAVEFCVLIMIAQMISALSSPMWMVVHATGYIKRYQITLSLINISIIPAAWFVLWMGFTPVYVIVSQIIINIIVFIYRLHFLKQSIGFDIKSFCYSVVFKCVKQVIIIIPLPIICRIIPGYIGEICALVLSIIIIPIVFYTIGLSKENRSQIKLFIYNRIK